MRRYLFIGILVLLFSCQSENKASLEINITSTNNDTIAELKAFYLTDLADSKKSISFHDIRSVSPNKFLLNNVVPGTYNGSINIEKGARYYIDLGNIVIKRGANKISEEINLGAVKPQINLAAYRTQLDARIF